MKFLDKIRNARGESETKIVVEHEQINLREMTIEQLLDSEPFERELIRQIEMETQHHDKMARQAFVSGLRLQRAPIVSLREKGIFDAENIRDIYKHIVCKTLKGFSAAEREYIKNLCMMSYWRVIEEYKQAKK
jgi:hypothetical protein